MESPRGQNALFGLTTPVAALIMSPIGPDELPQNLKNMGARAGTGFESGVIFVDSEDRLTIFNKAALRILRLGSAPQTADGLPDQLKTLIAEARSRGQAIIDRSTHVKGAGNQKIDVLATIIPMARDNIHAPVTIILQDFTAAECFQTSLQQLDRLANFGTLSAGIAHEIKNALVVGRTFFDLLLEKNTDSELVPLVRRELKRIESLVTQMVRYNTPVKPAFSAIALHEVIEHSLLMLERQLKDKSIKLEREYSASSDRVQGDDFQLEQAFVNLFLNAVEAMPLHGKMRVQTQLVNANSGNGPGSQLRVSIEDSGIGIPAENMDRLFTPFFTTKPAGTGLGLSITRRIIEQHGGTINASSKQGSGTCFQIFLPACNS
jgi:signal transduction histidine kinase